MYVSVTWMLCFPPSPSLTRLGVEEELGVRKKAMLIACFIHMHVSFIRACFIHSSMHLCMFHLFIDGIHVPRRIYACSNMDLCMLHYGFMNVSTLMLACYAWPFCEFTDIRVCLNQWTFSYVLMDVWHALLGVFFFPFSHKPWREEELHVRNIRQDMDHMPMIYLLRYDPWNSLLPYALVGLSSEEKLADLYERMFMFVCMNVCLRDLHALLSPLPFSHDPWGERGRGVRDMAMLRCKCA